MKFRHAPSAFKGGADGEAKIAASKVVILNPGDFADSWSKKPTKPIAVGLRILADADERTARAEAVKRAHDLYPDDEELAFEAYGEALKNWAVARGLCDPNNVEKSHPVFPMAEDMVDAQLNARAITRLFDELEKLQVESSPLFPEADDDQLHALAGLLAADEPLAGIDPALAARVRRYLGFALSELVALTDGDVDDPTADLPAQPGLAPDP